MDANPAVTLQQFKGLNNTVAPERLAPGELVHAVNIDIDDSGHVRRRRGATRLLTGQFHSLFEAEDGTIYVVRDGVLCRLLPSDQTVSLGATIGARRVAYVQVGQTLVAVNVPADLALKAGEPVGITVDPRNLHLFRGRLAIWHPGDAELPSDSSRK